MKIRLVSDLHLEFSEDFELEHLDTDKDTVLVLAGDIHTLDSACIKLRGWAERFKVVLYVPGNHEYYGGVITSVDYSIEDSISELDNVYYLSYNTGCSIKVDDVWFWGDTFWTSLDNKYDPNLDWHLKNNLNDFQNIKRYNEKHNKIVKYDVNCWRYYHKLSKEKLLEFLKGKVGEKVVVITHHAPNAKSSSDNFVGSILQPAYYTDMSNVILDNPCIKLWCHGHMHSSSDYMIGGTQVACNPYGYAGFSLNRDFNNTFSVDI